MFLDPALSWGVWFSLSCCGGLRGPHGISPHHRALTLSGHETKNTGFFWALWHVSNQPVMSVNCSPKKNGIKPSFHELQSVAGQISSTWTFPLSTTCHQVFLKINSLFNGKYCPCGKWLGNMRKVHKKKKSLSKVHSMLCCATWILGPAAVWGWRQNKAMWENPVSFALSKTKVYTSAG